MEGTILSLLRITSSELALKTVRMVRRSLLRMASQLHKIPVRSATPNRATYAAGPCFRRRQHHHWLRLPQGTPPTFATLLALLVLIIVMSSRDCGGRTCSPED